MGMYTSALITIDLRAVKRVADAYGLPKPRYIQDWWAELNLAEVRQYCDTASDLRFALSRNTVVADYAALELLEVGAVFEAQALHYFYEGYDEAGKLKLNHEQTQKLLRKRSKAFRVAFG